MTQFDATAYTGARQNHLHTLGRMTRYLWPADRTDLRVRVVAAMLALTVARLINVSVPYFYKRAVDALDTDANVIIIPLAMIFAYGGARLTQQLFGELRDFLFVRVAQHAQRTVALRTFRHLHALSLNFHLSRQTGALSRVIERGVRGIQFVLSFMLFNILPTLLEIGLVTGILFYMFNVYYAAIAGGTILLYVGFTLSVTEWRIKFRKQMNQTDSDANNKAVDSLLNFETVKYFSNEEHEFRRYDGALAGYERAAVRSQKSLTLLNIGQGLIISGGLIGLMVMAAFDVRDKHITIGDFVMINTYLIQLYLPLNFLGFVYREIKQSLVDMEKMFELLDVERDILDRNDAHELPAVHEPKTDFTNHAPAALDRIRPADASESGELIFEDVHFAYRSDRPILKGVSFRVQPGRTVAIVGPSGAGKSTIARLLFRFYDIQQGSIRIDGVDLRELTQHSVRAAIGIVPQDTVLFNDTIRYNIEYGRTGATPAEIEQAARLARIHDFVMSLPDGYDTLVGERGLKLSGGEKQRVAIARTILKHPRILLFDEATSALDSHTEKEIQASLREVSRNRTTLVIAHRLSTIVDADEILVMKAGQILERGTHAQLLTADGEYADMWNRQQEARTYEQKLNEALADEQ